MGAPAGTKWALPLRCSGRKKPAPVMLTSRPYKRCDAFDVLFALRPPRLRQKLMLQHWVNAR